MASRTRRSGLRILAAAFLVFLWAASAAAQDNETCLACHGTKDIQAMATKKGDFFIDPAKHQGSVHGPLGCTTCHSTISEYPHPRRVPKVECATCHAETPADVAKSAHAALGAQACASCHGNVHTVQAAGAASPQQCATCHADAVRDYRSSVHLEARRHGDVEGATCQSCHGPAHKILPASDPSSMAAKHNLPDTCGACHANPEFLAKHRIDFARPVEAYRLSVHGRALAAGEEAAASCSDCHSNHAIVPARDPRSKINHWKVAETCGACHSQIRKAYDESVHGQAAARGVRDSPVCTDCHGEHIILAPNEPRSLVNPARVSSVTCGRCHSDERLTQRYNLPTDKVPAYEDSFHGLALRSGSQTVANCASCHGVHNILPSSDPRSTISPANLARTCGACHPGAGERFAIGPVHVRPATATEHPVVRWIRVAYLILIPLTIGFMLFHHLIDFFRKLVSGAPRIRSGETVERMNFHFRMAHWLVLVSFPVLVFTGFALKFPESWWAELLLRWEAEFAVRGTIHRIAGVVLIASLVYHLIHLIASRRDRAILRHLRPGIEDVTQMFAMVRYNLGLASEPPAFGKFNYAEKIEYLAFVWGSVVMAVSGFLLWFNDFTLRNFPTWVTDAATAIHYYEALLATFSILIWHFYIVIFDPDVYPMDKAWLTGRASADHLRHTRPAYYLELVRQQQREPSPEEAPADPPPASHSAAPPTEADKKTENPEEKSPPSPDEKD